MPTTGPKLTIPFLVGAGQIVGQGNTPEAWVLYSTDDATDTDPLWQDATAKLRGDQAGFSTSRGRDSELGEVDAGTATITLDNRARTFDPVINPAIRPLNRWKILSQFSGVTESIFTGYAESYDQQWSAPVGDAITVVSCADLFKVLALDKLPVTDPPRDSYENVVMFDNPSGYWRFSDVSLNGTAGQALIGTRTGAGTFTIENATPIIGDQYGDATVRGGSLSLLTTVSVSTGARPPNTDFGTPGDAGGCTELTIEMWFKSDDATPSSDGVMAFGAPTSVGRQWSATLNTTGKVVFSVSTGAASTSVTTTTTLLDNTWYHVVCTITGGFLRIYLNGVQDVQTAFSADFGELDPANDEPTLVLGGSSTGATFSYDEVAFYRIGLPATRVAAHYAAGALRGYPRGQLPGPRVEAVLATIGSSAPRSIQAGTNTMTGSFMAGQDPLGELRQAVRAESVDAVLFVSRNGTITFLADGHRSASPYNTVQATFDDDGTDLPYVALDVDYSESFLLNAWNVTRVNGTLTSASDATSISRFYKRAQSLTDLPLVLDADATAIAAAMLAKYKDPLTRILSIGLTTDDPAVTEAALARDIGDRIRVLRTPPGGGARIDQTLFIQKISVDAAPGAAWQIVWAVSPV